MSHLARHNGPSSPTLSTLSERFPQHPYYRFYYAAEASGRSWLHSKRSAQNGTVLCSLFKPSQIYSPSAQPVLYFVKNIPLCNLRKIICGCSRYT
jgi:hypothetical protein